MRGRRGGGSDRLLATVMFTDIVGSTELASRLGDKAWKALVARHNAIVRRELKRFAGRELDTAGDGFFVMFERPAQAIDCAWSIIAALKQLDLQIRAAIHMGEVEVMDRKVGGIAVHAASRLLSLAGSGEIYVTGIVHDVVAGGDTQFADRGVHELRGVPGEWRVYEVQATARDRTVRVEPLPEPASNRRTWVVIAPTVAIVAILAAIGTALALAGFSRPPPVTPHANSVVRINTADNSFASLVDIEDPTEMAIEDDALWVLSVSGRTLTRVGLQGGTPRSAGLPAAPTGLATGDDAVWVTAGFGSSAGRGGVLRIGMTSLQLEDTIELGDGVDGIAVGDGSVWVTNRIHNVLTRIDLTTRVVSGTLDVGEQPGSVVVDDDSIWVGNAIDRTIWRIDDASMQKTAEISLADTPYDVAIGFGRLWVTSEAASSLTLIDTSTNTILRTLTMPGVARGVSVGPAEVFVAVGGGDIAVIDPDEPEEFSVVSVGGAPYDVAATEGGVWVSIRE